MAKKFNVSLGLENGVVVNFEATSAADVLETVAALTGKDAKAPGEQPPAEQLDLLLPYTKTKRRMSKKAEVASSPPAEATPQADGAVAPLVEYTEAQVREAVMDYARSFGQHGIQMGGLLLRKFGVGRVSELTPEQYGDVMACLATLGRGDVV